MFVKICGVSNAVDAAAVNESSAEAIGFVMGGPVLPVEVEPAAQTVRGIIKTLRPSLLTTLVTHLADVKEILDLAEYIGCRAIQVSEPLSPADLQTLRKATGRIIIKTVVAEKDSLPYLKAVQASCDYILLDSKVSGYIGGTGATSDWDICRALTAQSEKPVLLAGGLTPANISRAIRAVRPAGVDVSTGISCFSPDYPRKDRKDGLKIGEFLRRAKEEEC